MVRLVGMATKAVSFLISDESIGTNLDIDVSLVKEINLVRSEIDFDDLVSKPSEKYHRSSFALLLPFLIKVVIETINHSPVGLFAEFMIVMVTFDREKSSQDEFTWTESGSILQFL